ncbi:MAG: hypothetical protein K8M05_12895, partial [Deltaproteobacteria bacterium]|nr:hypothetical protein [Kofleriaceae bacterium]
MRALAIVAIMGLGLGLVTAAAADGTTLEGRMETAQAAEKHATESRDPEAFQVCGQAYVEVAKAARTERPEWVAMALYNAGVCFEHARSVTAAVAMYRQLEAELPRDPLVQRAHARRAQLYLAIAWYAEAAKELEAYATKWAGERDASDALENAVRLRAALGDDDAARRNAERWVKLYA